MSKKIRTVCGDVAPDEIGFTSSHDHVIADMNTVRSFLVSSNEVPFPEEMLKLNYENLNFLRSGGWILSKDVVETSNQAHYDFLLKELMEFKKAGGDCIVDPTPIGVRGDIGAPGAGIGAVRELSEKSGVKIVCATGLYHDTFMPPELKDKSEDELKAIFEDEIANGIGDSGIKPGFLKAAIGFVGPDGAIHPNEIKVFRAICRVAVETGMGIEVHLTSPASGIKEALVFADIALNEYHVNPRKLCFCHVGNLIAEVLPIDEYILHGSKYDIDGHRELLSKGVLISFDDFGSHPCQSSEFDNTYRPSDYIRIRAVHELINEGYVSQLLMSHDFCCKTAGKSYGGHGYCRVISYVCPMLKKLGHTDEEIRTMTIDTPREFLAF